MVYFKPHDDTCNRVEYKGDKVLHTEGDWIIKEIWVYEYENPTIKLTVEPKPKEKAIKIIEE